MQRLGLMGKTIVIQPGGFHPWHAGHYALYQSAQRTFPDAEVYVAATNDTSERPFPFAIKEKLAYLAGVEPGHFVQVKSPFRADEITSQFDPEKDQLIFVRSTKDAKQPPIPGGVKKDGKPSYLQPLLGAKKLDTFGKHAYMAYLPTVEFGPGMTSATEIRSAWPTLNDQRKTALVMSLYPKTQSNPKLAATVVKMLDTAIGGPVGETYDHTAVLAESTVNESPAVDVIRSLISEFNTEMSGSPYYPMDYKNPGMRMWTRGDGSKYKDPGYIFIERDLKPEDQPKWHKAKAVEKFWKFLESKGARKIGDVSGEFGSDPHSPAVVLNKLIFVFNGRSIAWGSTSRLKNSSVWRQKQQGVAEGVKEANTSHQHHVVSKLDGNVLASYKTKQEAHKNAHGNPVVSGSLETIGDKQYVREQGVAEGLADTQQKIVDTINKLEDRLKHAKTPEQWDNIKNRIDRLQAGLNRSKQGVAEDGVESWASNPSDRRHPGHESYMTPEYMLAHYKKRLAQIAAGKHKYPKEVAQLQAKIAKLEKPGVDESHTVGYIQEKEKSSSANIDADPELRQAKIWAKQHYGQFDVDPEVAFDKWVQRGLKHSQENDVKHDKLINFLTDKIIRLERELKQTTPAATNEDYVEEQWSEKYKRSIDCSNPRGFSQRAHCAGRKK